MKSLGYEPKRDFDANKIMERRFSQIAVEQEERMDVGEPRAFAVDVMAGVPRGLMVKERRLVAVDYGIVSLFKEQRLGFSVRLHPSLLEYFDLLLYRCEWLVRVGPKKMKAATRRQPLRVGGGSVKTPRRNHCLIL